MSDGHVMHFDSVREPPCAWTAPGTVRMKLSEVKIPEGFLSHPPAPAKIAAKRAILAAGDKDSRASVLESLTVTAEGVLVDGYAGFLAMKELGELSAAFRVAEPAVFAHCRFEGKKKTYTWAVADGAGPVAKGDRVAVQTCRGLQPAIVKHVFCLPADNAIGRRKVVGPWHG